MATSSPTKVQFTVGKLDAGMAILLTQDHHQIEFPSILLPKTVTTGSIIDLSVIQNPTQEAQVHKAFLDLQSTIRTTFATKSPSAPILSLRNVTQTSAVLEWESIDIATAEIKSLTLWRDGTRLGNIPKPLTTTTTKLSGLAIDTDYIFQLVLRTTAGTYSSGRLKIRTHKLTNLSGITVCEGTLPLEQHERLVSAIEAIGAKPLQKRVRIDTTHFICSVPEGEEWQRAKEMNVPIVVVDWIEACQQEGKILGVRGYYLDADPTLRPTPTKNRTSQSTSRPSVTEKTVELPLPQTPTVETISEKEEDHSETTGPVRPMTESTSPPAVPPKISQETENAKTTKMDAEPKSETQSSATRNVTVEDEEEKFDDVPI